jgi:hypothetical protein
MVVALATGVVATTSVLAGPASAVSTPTPNPPVNCPVAPELSEFVEDPGYTLGSLRAEAVEPGGAYPSRNQAVQLSWTGIEPGDGCIAVYVRGPASAFSTQPYARLGPHQDSWTHQSISEPGRVCYRLVAIFGAARGPFAKTCADVRAAAVAEGSPDSFARAAVGLAALALLATLGLLLLRFRGPGGRQIGHRPRRS